MKQEQHILFSQLVKHAFEDEHSDFELITNKYMYKVVVVFKHAVKKVIKKFNVAITKAAQKFECDGLNNEIAELIIGFNYCLDYYKKELAIAESMLKEYKNYLGSGHRLWSLIGGERSEELMFEHTNDFIDIFEEV